MPIGSLGCSSNKGAAPCCNGGVCYIDSDAGPRCIRKPPVEAMTRSDCSVLGCGWAGGLCLDVGDACDTTACHDAYEIAFKLRGCNKTNVRL